MTIVQSRRGYARGILSFADIVRLWPSYADLAEDCGVAYQTVAAWARRSSIPHEHWEHVERSARKWRIKGVTYDYLRSVDANMRLGGGNG